jgi:hypothetical protein
MGEERNARLVLLGKSVGERPLEALLARWKVILKYRMFNLKVDLF